MYNLKEHERYEKRVDIFRTVQQSPHKAVYQLNASKANKMMLIKGSSAFVNQSYMSSEMSLDHGLRLSGENRNPLYDSEEPVWTTQVSFTGSPGEKKIEQQSANRQLDSPSTQASSPLPQAAQRPLSPVKDPISFPITRFPSKAEFYPPLSQEKSIDFRRLKRRNLIIISCLLLLAIVIAVIVILVVVFRSNYYSQSPPLSADTKGFF